MTTIALAMSRPAVSSPLSAPAQGAQRVPQRRASVFPTSRALRPFPTVSHLVQPPKPGQTSSPKAKPVKLIEPPKNFKTTFVLDLTQAEFSRQE